MTRTALSKNKTENENANICNANLKSGVTVVFLFRWFYLFFKFVSRSRNPSPVLRDVTSVISAIWDLNRVESRPATIIFNLSHNSFPASYNHHESFLHPQQPTSWPSFFFSRVLARCKIRYHTDAPLADRSLVFAVGAGESCPKLNRTWCCQSTGTTAHDLNTA